jgi:putative restriction endonuclease
VRHDVLEEHDGPMLKHGLQEMHASKIILPGRAANRPNRDYLEERFAKFLAA